MEMSQEQLKTVRSHVETSAHAPERNSQRTAAGEETDMSERHLDRRISRTSRKKREKHTTQRNNAQIRSTR